MSTPIQDYSAAITWTSDWTAHLAGNGALTISSATATCSTPGVTVASTTVTGAGKSVTFKVSQTGITTPIRVFIVVAVTLSNGDTDQRNFPIQFTDT